MLEAQPSHGEACEILSWVSTINMKTTKSLVNLAI